jgi:hypothetical protein
MDSKHIIGLDRTLLSDGLMLTVIASPNATFEWQGGEASRAGDNIRYISSDRMQKEEVRVRVTVDGVPSEWITLSHTDADRVANIRKAAQARGFNIGL